MQMEVADSQQNEDITQATQSIYKDYVNNGEFMNETLLHVVVSSNTAKVTRFNNKFLTRMYILCFRELKFFGKRFAFSNLFYN